MLMPPVFTFQFGFILIGIPVDDIDESVDFTFQSGFILIAFI